MKQYGKYLVGYLDLLGAKNLMKSDSNGKFLETVYRCYEDALAGADALGETTGSPFQTKIFSDNILIALPCNESSTNNDNPVIALNRMTAIIGALQRQFLEKNILTRGGITYGDLFIDDLMVFGTALIDAYELENSVAIFPRVAISGNAQQFDVIIGADNHLESANKLREDNDGVFYLDYLNFPQGQGVKSLISKSLEWVTAEINNEKDQKIIQKLDWHKNYLKQVSQENKIDFLAEWYALPSQRDACTSLPRTLYT